jgi:phosphate transport system substrate-binding protein
MTRRTFWVGAAGVAALVFSVAEAKVLINAAGATFPYPIYGKWFDEFTKVYPDAQVNYQSLGSGAGIRQVTAGTVDFGASDMPMTDEQIKACKVHPLHFPTVMGGVVMTYNIPGVTADLKFTSQALAGIFLGKITKWNDPELQKANSGVKLPAADIVVVHRSEGSGTTFCFTDYLSKVSPEWKSKVGVNASVNWPVGLGGKGSEGVSGTVKQTPNSVGYVELIYALQNKMAYGFVQNSSGAFLKANLESVTEAAAAAAKDMPEDFRVSITNAPGKGAYPISTFTWLLIPSKIEDAGKKKAIVTFLHWMLSDGQKDAAGLGYAPLPKSVISKEEKQISLVK